MRAILPALLAKDVRAIAPWLAIYWLLAALPSFQRLITPLPDKDIVQWMAPLWWLQLAVGTLAVGKLFQLDFPGDPRGFLRTRPVGHQPIIWSKLATILLWLVIPACVFQVVVFFALGFRLSPADIMLSFADTALLIGVALFLSAIPALVIRQLGYYLLVPIAAWIVVEMLGAMFIDNLPRGPLSWSPADWDQQRASAQIAAQAVSIAAAIAAAWVYARSPGLRTFALSALGLITVGIGTWALWPWNFVAALAEPDLVAPRSEWPDTDAMKWESMPEKYMTPVSVVRFSGGSYDGVRTQYIQAGLDVPGVKDPWDARPLRVEAELRLKNGAVFTQEREYWDDPNAIPLLRTWGAKYPHYDESPRVAGTLFQYRVDQITASPQAAMLRGTDTVAFRRAKLLAQLPVRVGANYTSGRHRFTIRRVVVGAGEVHVEAIQETAFIRFRTNPWNESTRVRQTWTLWNPVAREMGNSTSSGDGKVADCSYRARYSEKTFQRFTSKDRDADIPPDWLDHAFVCLFTSEAGGTRSMPFEFGPLDLAQ